MIINLRNEIRYTSATMNYYNDKTIDLFYKDAGLDKH